LPAPGEERLVEALDLEHAVDRLEPLLFVLLGLLSRLLDRLEVRLLGCGDLSLRLDLQDGGRDARHVGVAAPTRDLRVWIRLLHQALEARPPEAPVEAAHLETRGVPARRDQLDLFRPAGPAPETLSQVLAFLGSVCGDERVGAPVLADSHHPDALALGSFAPKPVGGEAAGGEDVPDTDGDPQAFTAPLALRILRPPVSAQVRQQGEQPVWIRSPVANGPVLRCAGPWRTTGGWWSSERPHWTDRCTGQAG
jgi:protein ImuB